MEDSLDLLSGWWLENVIDRAASVHGHMNGDLFFYLQDITRKFCDRVSNMQISSLSTS